MVEIE
jgi:hypothetical protein